MNELIFHIFTHWAAVIGLLFLLFALLALVCPPLANQILKDIAKLFGYKEYEMW